jgi:RNA polymerase sigma factor (sigma-70 family)
MTIAPLDERSDFELVTATREGSNDAFAELWNRHARAATNFATTLRDLADPDDLVSEAYIRVFTAIKAGGGPSGVFRAYLLTAVRNTALNWGRAKQKEIGHEDFDVFLGSDSAEELTLQELERTTTSRAFKSLPTRYQEALWYAEVEHIPRAEIATILGMNANAVSQLTFRARDALRTAWLQEHINTEHLEPECAAVAGLVAGYVRETINRRQRKQVDDHARECAGCLLVIDEVSHLAERLTFVILPLAVGITGAAAYGLLVPSGAASAVGFTATRTGGKAAGASSSAPHVGIAALVGAGVIVAVAIAATFAATLNSQTTAASHKGPANIHAPSTTHTPKPAPAPTPTPTLPKVPNPVQVVMFQPSTPVAAPAAPAPPPTHARATVVVATPAPVITPAPAPTPQTQPSSTPTPTPDPQTVPPAPAVTWDIDPAGWLLPSASGTADPGSTVAISADGTVVATAAVDPTGSWSVANIPLTTGVHEVTAAQRNAANVRSAPTAPVSVTLNQPTTQVNRLNGNLADIWIGTPDGLQVVLTDPACHIINISNGTPTTTYIHCQDLPAQQTTITYDLAPDGTTGLVGPIMQVTVPADDAQPSPTPNPTPSP